MSPIEVVIALAAIFATVMVLIQDRTIATLKRDLSRANSELATTESVRDDYEARLATRGEIITAIAKSKQVKT